jgi:hypothetical protein
MYEYPYDKESTLIIRHFCTVCSVCATESKDPVMLIIPGKDRDVCGPCSFIKRCPQVRMKHD